MANPLWTGKQSLVLPYINLHNHIVHGLLLCLCLSGYSLPGYTQAEDELIIEEEQEDTPIEDSLIIDDGSDSDEYRVAETDGAESPAEGVVGVHFDQLWFEYGRFHSHSDADHQWYGNAKASLDWQSGPWEFRAAVRVDGYRGDWDQFSADYGDTYVRYKSKNGIVTAGAQTIIWGRIDEFPPSDRLSTQDLRRGLMDDLEDRRLSSLAVRYEHFFPQGKLDLFYLPRFREAELPDADSVWYPINQREGTILGLDTYPLIENVVRQAGISEHEPESDGGFGLRFNHLGQGLDYALGISHGISTLPYFAYDPKREKITARYLRSTTLFGDLGLEALGGTVKLEAAWNNDTPVTRRDGRFTSVDSLAWGVAYEVFPGDGDTRLNLQLTGNHLLDDVSVLDRDNAVLFNGSVETPFADNNWRARLRFNVGLDMDDRYLNPELTYTGFRNQELYLEAHLFDGEKGSLGGFYDDDSLLSVGWRLNL